MLVLLVQYIDEYRKTATRAKSDRNDNGELKGGRDLGLEDRNGGKNRQLLKKIILCRNYFHA